MPEILRLMTNARRSRREVLDAHGAWSRDRRPHSPTAARIDGRQGRGAALIIALLGGLVLAVALIGQFSVWTH